MVSSLKTCLLLILLAQAGALSAAQACLAGNIDCAKRLFAQHLAANQEFLAGNQFEIRRVAAQYKHHLTGRFEEEILSLPENSHYIDAGAGNAYAIEDYATRPEKTLKSRKLTAIGYAKPEQAVTEIPGRDFRYLAGRTIENIPASEIGAADLMSDLYGPFSYTPQIDQVLTKYLEVLKVDRPAYIYFNPTKTTINNSASGLGDYLKAIQGAEVEWIKVDEWDHTAVLRIRKKSENFSVPKLKLENFISGDPNHPAKGAIPQRWYSW